MKTQTLRPIVNLPLTLVTLLAGASAPAIAHAGWSSTMHNDISQGEIITLRDSWLGSNTICNGADCAAAMPNLMMDRPVQRKLSGCDGSADIDGGTLFETSMDTSIQGACQSVSYRGDDAMLEMLDSLGFVMPDDMMFLSQYSQLQYYSSGDNDYSANGGDGVYIKHALNSLDGAEQQLFGDAEIFAFNNGESDRNYRAAAWGPNCDFSDCADPLSWGSVRLRVTDSSPTVADDIATLLEYFGLGDYWDSNLYYWDWDFDDNNDDTYFKAGISTAQMVLQGIADEDPLASIFTKVTSDSYAKHTTTGSGLVGHKQPVYFNFAVPDSTDISDWATDKNYAYPDQLEWAVCFNIDIAYGTSLDHGELLPYTSILDQMSYWGLIKHYHVAGDGIKPFVAASGSYEHRYYFSGSTDFGEPILANGFFFAYDPADAAVLSLIDTGNFACSWDTVNYTATSWLSRDNPGGTGDYEDINNHYNAGNLPCSDPFAIEARRKSDDMSAFETGYTFGRFDTDYGFYCRNSHNSSTCPDYEVRFYCED